MPRKQIKNYKLLPRREVSLDILRGIAVLTMIAAHVVAFLHTQESSILRGVQIFGDTVSFTTFLFVSGSVTYFAYIKQNKHDWVEKKSKVLERLIKLLLGYYLVAVISTLNSLSLPPSIEWVKHLGKILLFVSIPGYTEFLLPFIFYGLIVFLLRDPLKKLLKKNILMLIVLGLVSYAVGSFIYHIQIPTTIATPVSLFTGYQDWYRFPLLQYAIVFLGGIVLGEYLSRDLTDKKKNSAILKIAFGLFILFIANLVFDPLSAFPYETTFQRWPPSFGFLIASTTFVLLGLFFIRVLIKSSTSGFFKIMLQYWGRHAFSMYISHIIILQILNYVVSLRTTNIFLLIFYFFFIIFACSLIINKMLSRRSNTQSSAGSLKLYVKSQPTTRRGYGPKPNRYLFLKEKYFWTVIIVLTISVAVVLKGSTALTSFQQDFRQSREQDIDAQYIQPEILGASNVKAYPWWNEDYSYYKQLTISNESDTKISGGIWIRLAFDHRQTATESKTLIDGADLKLLYLQGNTYQEVSFELANPNRTNTRIDFQLINEIGVTKEDSNYFLYYGNPFGEPLIQDEDDNFVDYNKRSYAQNYALFTNTESTPLIYGSTNRRWILKDQQVEPEFAQLTYVLKLHQSVTTDSTPTYTILGTNISGQMIKLDTQTYQVTIPTNNIVPGRYHIQANLTASGVEESSQKAGFYVSYPLYVAWTLDWEGVDVSDDELDNLIAFSENHYDLPMTQFFNPRIYVTSEISQDRQDHLTQWVKTRKITGDEVGLHLHMYHDMVKAAGVGVKTQPKWTNYLNNGLDVPTTVYSYDEFTQILTWAKQEFVNQGFEEPTSFRAGGWFADESTLQALSDSGFVIDSSGRQYYVWGNNGIKGHWNLNSTTKPYQPSTVDQNSPTPTPQLPLWEFPNNGSDSWFYTTEDLIERFDDNYNKEPLTEKQTLTYLSHPHKFIRDSAVLNPTYDYIDQFVAYADRGPVLYVTLEQLYPEYAG